MLAGLGWRDRVHAAFDGLIASQGFRRWAASFFLTRPIARRRARALFDLCAGFVYSQVLLACVQLRLFERLAQGPATTEQIAPQLGLTVEAAERLLAAATALDLTKRRSGQRYGLGALGSALVGNAALIAMIEHHALVYGDLQDPVALLRGQVPGSGLSRYWPYAPAGQPETLTSREVAGYSSLMSASQPLIADQVLSAYPFHRHQCLLDVGGGEGRFLAAIAAQAKGLRLMLFDLPAVADRARAALAAQGLAQRVEVHGGSFLDQPLPEGADLISLVRVLHDHDDEAVARVLAAAYRALPPGGTVLIAEPMARTPGAEAVGDAYFGFYLLAMGRGRARTPQRLTELLAAAGFEGATLRRTALPLQAQVLVARRPA